MIPKKYSDEHEDITCWVGDAAPGGFVRGWRECVGRVRELLVVAVNIGVSGGDARV